MAGWQVSLVRNSHVFDSSETLRLGEKSAACRGSWEDPRAVVGGCFRGDLEDLELFSEVTPENLR